MYRTSVGKIAVQMWRAKYALNSRHYGRYGRLVHGAMKQEHTS